MLTSCSRSYRSSRVLDPALWGDSTVQRAAEQREREDRWGLGRVALAARAAAYGLVMSETRTQIIEATTRMAVFTDGRRWDDLPGIFTPTVRLDYSALFGSEAADMNAAEVASSWAEALSPLTTQHLVTNHLVDITDDEATVTASFQATHVAVATGDRWVVGGDYRYQLVRAEGRWLIRSVTLTPRWETGDRSIVHASS
jgi:hypothetical protein